MSVEPQHMQALKLANASRLDRARLKRGMRAGAVCLSDVLVEPCVARMTVYDLLICQRRYGRQRVLAVLKQAGGVKPIGEQRLVGSLTERERRALVDACKPVSERSVA